MKRLRPLVLLVVVALGIYFGRKYWKLQDAKAAPTGEFHGNVEVRDVTLSFRVGGRVATVTKREGDRVAIGEVIARLDDAPYKLAVAQSRALVEVARAQLRAVAAGARREDIAEASAQLSQRKAVLAQADDVLARTKALYERGAATEASYTEAKSATDQADAGVKSAAALLWKLQTGARREDIDVAQAQVAQAEAALATAELSVADTELRAPTAGVVVTRAIEPGAMVGVGAPILVVAFEEPVWIRAFADERELGRIAPGTPVEVVTDGNPNHPFTGQVGYVSAQAEFTPKNVETSELRTSLVYRFRVIVTGSDGMLRQGMPVTVRPKGPPPSSPSPSARASSVP
jgi:HlyD family secretion protein